MNSELQWALGANDANKSYDILQRFRMAFLGVAVIYTTAMKEKQRLERASNAKQALTSFNTLCGIGGDVWSYTLDYSLVSNFRLSETSRVNTPLNLITPLHVAYACNWGYFTVDHWGPWQKMLTIGLATRETSWAISQTSLSELVRTIMLMVLVL